MHCCDLTPGKSQKKGVWIHGFHYHWAFQQQLALAFAFGVKWSQKMCAHIAVYRSLYHCKSSQRADLLMVEELRGPQSICSSMWLKRSSVFKRAAHWSVKITFDVWVTSELCEMKAEITLLTSRAINTEVCKNTLLNAFVLEAKMCVATNQN